MTGYWKRPIGLPMRLLLLACGILLLIPDVWISLVGLAAGGVSFFAVQRDRGEGVTIKQ